MNHDDPTPESQAPAQRAIVIASFACFGSLILCYWVAKPVIQLIDVPWAELLVYSIIPLSLTFAILYRSSWHREIAGALRICLLLLLSGVVLVGVLFGIGVALCLAWFCLNALSGGNHP